MELSPDGRNAPLDVYGILDHILEVEPDEAGEVPRIHLSFDDDDAGGLVAHGPYRSSLR